MPCPMLISSGNFRPAQSVVNTSIRSHRSSNALCGHSDHWKKTKMRACKLVMLTFWMWRCTSLVDRLAPMEEVHETICEPGDEARYDLLALYRCRQSTFTKPENLRISMPQLVALIWNAYMYDSNLSHWEVKNSETKLFVAVSLVRSWW